MDKPLALAPPDRNIARLRVPRIGAGYPKLALRSFGNLPGARLIGAMFRRAETSGDRAEAAKKKTRCGQYTVDMYNSRA